MIKNQKIEVRAARTQTEVLNHECGVVNEFETITSAKRQAQRYLTDEYAALAEISEPFQYAQVVVNDECLYDYFRKGYNGEDGL